MRLRPVTLVVTFALGLLAGPLPAQTQERPLRRRPLFR